jgi:hypothetical protein
MKIRTELRAGGENLNHNEVLVVRSALKAGRIALNHNEALGVRSAPKAGKLAANHATRCRCAPVSRPGGCRPTTMRA